MLGAVERGEQGSHRIRGSGYGTSPIPREASRRAVATKPLRPPPKAAADLCAGAGMRGPCPLTPPAALHAGTSCRAGPSASSVPPQSPTYFWTLPTAPILPAAPGQSLWPHAPPPPHRAGLHRTLRGLGSTGTRPEGICRTRDVRRSGDQGRVHVEPPAGADRDSDRARRRGARKPTRGAFKGAPSFLKETRPL